MAETGSRKPATDMSAAINMGMLRREGLTIGRKESEVADKIRKELKEKGLKGFKKGGKVKKAGVYKLHKGEKVITAKQAAASKKPAAKKPAVRLRGRRI